MIRPGTVWVWEEEETNMRRWTDGRRWGASRVGGGGFLVYTESTETHSPPPGHPDSAYHHQMYAPRQQESLIKQTYSTSMTHPVTGKVKKFHVVAYSSKHNPQGDAHNPLPLPHQLPLLSTMKVSPGIWPEWEHNRGEPSIRRPMPSTSPYAVPSRLPPAHTSPMTVAAPISPSFQPPSRSTSPSSYGRQGAWGGHSQRDPKDYYPRPSPGLSADSRFNPYHSRPYRATDDSHYDPPVIRHISPPARLQAHQEHRVPSSSHLSTSNHTSGGHWFAPSIKISPDHLSAPVQLPPTPHSPFDMQSGSRGGNSPPKLSISGQLLNRDREAGIIPGSLTLPPLRFGDEKIRTPGGSLMIYNLSSGSSSGTGGGSKDERGDRWDEDRRKLGELGRVPL